MLSSSKHFRAAVAVAALIATLGANHRPPQYAVDGMNLGEAVRDIVHQKGEPTDVPALRPSGATRRAEL